MTPQEHQLLSGFLNNLTTARAQSIDPEADRLIRDAFSRQPQAAYLVVQQALMQQMSVQEAQHRIAELEQQLRDARGGASGTSSFLGGAAQAPGAGSPPPTAPSGWGNPATAPGAPRSSGFGNFLRSAATTAAGVAGGAMLFQGIENLFGGHRGVLGGGGFLGGGTPEIVENNTVTNEYDDPGLQNMAEDGQVTDDGFGNDADFGGDGGLFDNGDDSTDWV